MTVQQATENLMVLLLVCGISFWGSLLFSPHTRPRLAESWGWLKWRPLPHDMGKVLLGAFFLSFLVQATASPLLVLVDTWPGSLQIALTLLVYQGLIVVVLYRHLHHQRVSERDAFGMAPGQGIPDLAWGVAGYCMMIPLVGLAGLLAQLLSHAAGIELNPQQTVEMIQGQQEVINSLLLFVLVGFVGPFLEEIIFRGVLFPVLVRCCGVGWGLVLQGLIFSVVHMHIGSALPLWALGMVLGFLYVHTRRMMVCVWAHAIFNSVTLIMHLPIFGAAQG